MLLVRCPVPGKCRRGYPRENLTGFHKLGVAKQCACFSPERLSPFGGLFEMLEFLDLIDIKK
jgi:hypothetical protein